MEPAIKSRFWPVVLLAILNLLLVAAVAWQLRERFWSDAAATVNDRTITRSEVLSALQLAPSVEVTNQTFQTTLQRLIESEAVFSEAGSGVEKPELMELTAHQFLNRAEFVSALAAANLSPDALAGRLRDWQSVISWLDRQPVPSPAEEQIHAFFDRHPEAFTLPEVVEAKQFALIFEPRFSLDNRAATETRFDKILEKLKDGVPFDELIETASDDPAKNVTHGNLHWFQRTRMTASEIPDAAFQTPTGQISAPVKTRYGFHLLQITGRKPARALTFEEARPELIIRVTDELRREKVRKIVEGALARAKVEIRSGHLK